MNKYERSEEYANQIRSTLTELAKNILAGKFTKVPENIAAELEGFSRVDYEAGYVQGALDAKNNR